MTLRSSSQYSQKGVNSKLCASLPCELEWDRSHWQLSWSVQYLSIITRVVILVRIMHYSCPNKLCNKAYNLMIYRQGDWETQLIAHDKEVQTPQCCHAVRHCYQSGPNHDYHGVHGKWFSLPLSMNSLCIFVSIMLRVSLNFRATFFNILCLNITTEQLHARVLSSKKP